MKTKAKAESSRGATPIPANCEALMSRSDVAAALRVSVRHLDGMISLGEYPGPDVRLGKLPRWHRETHDRWIRRLCGKEV